MGINQQWRTKTRTQQKKPRKRKVTWFNPPFSDNVKTNIGRKFLTLVIKHFPRDHKYHRIFNENTIKLSYCTMDNMASMIMQHNAKVLSEPVPEKKSNCNCQAKSECPLDGNCLTKSIVYQATVSTDTAEKIYYGTRIQDKILQPYKGIQKQGIYE